MNVSSQSKGLSLATYAKRAIICLAAALLISCAQSPQRSTQPTTSPVEQNVVTPANKGDTLTAEQWLEKARNEGNAASQQMALVEASFAFQNQGNYQRSAAILSQLDPTTMRPSDKRLYALSLARWYHHSGEWQQVVEQLAPIMNQFTDRQLKRTSLLLIADAYQQQKHYWQALSYLDEAYQTDSNMNLDTLWSVARQVNSEQLPSQRPNRTSLAGWWRLIESTHRAQSADNLKQALEQWLTAYNQHYARSIVESFITHNDFQVIKEVAVLLPLSGSYRLQGEAVRDGIIASAAQLADVHVRFYDTEAEDLTALQARLLENEQQFVIGPLLKKHVNAWVQQPMLGVTQVYLNQPELPDDVIIPSGHVTFALDSETEAAQAADYISETAKLSSIIFAAKSGAGTKMVNAYKRSWPTDSERTVESSWYSSTEEMQSAVEHALGVAASAERIRNVKIAAGKIIVDAQERSRSDVDAIYIAGNLEQARLLKPFIDVNLSPFAPPADVFASSAIRRVTNQTGDNDLRGIVFTEAPILLPNQQPFAINTWLKLHANADLNDARLVAMGHDSLTVLEQIDSLRWMRGKSISGMTGRLSIHLNNIHRQMSWAKLTPSEVNVIKP
ncbi:penicillin-binding protein activator [Idiomarina sp.]|uniref:penicillin-binding protein activator n=1 Tax=Idiomarina sp. TaxID=1874361 RepID=UPI0025C73C95|nr:penicillin-binding protein activator [Idiomarina sp.]NQZ03307.1 penicillin-binding protein activator [Idiomarina sp.]